MLLKDIVDNELTDKNTLHSYLDTYQSLFEQKRETAQNVMEIGIYRGGSIKLWLDYFVNATIYGIDIFGDDILLDEIRNKKDRTVLSYSTNAYDKTTVNIFLDKKFDIIIDDGSHELSHMKFVVENYLQLLEKDGILIIEDVPDWGWIAELSSVVPEELKQYIKTFDLRGNKNRWDDIIFCVDLSLCE
jgi:SAM-dependent methyltransferase